MNTKTYLMIFLFGIQLTAHAAFDTKSVLQKIGNAAVPGPVIARAPGGGGGTPYDDNVRRLRQESDAAFELKATCDGRFNILRFNLKRTVARSEWISVGGGLFGVFGAVATCPHCAAIGAGLAGLANPLQQTFKDNEDTPEVYRAKLIALSEKINTEFEEYRKLPAADPASNQFEQQLRARLDVLTTIAASCQYYESQTATEVVAK